MNVLSPGRAVLKAVGDDPLWYKDAVIYQLHLKSFFDSNNDGIGDFAGLMRKLDYIVDLGVNTLWLLPFYPSPRLDDGYDISDYRGVHPDYGTMADVRRFLIAAHERGIRVITELVINHTSDQHAWFQRARRAKPGSSWRNFYVWSDDDKRYPGTRIIFVDTERSNWTWDPVANAFFWHRFYSHQPDLNFDNPMVLRAVLSVMRFWLNMGVDGLRLDAVPYLAEREGTINENLPETHAILKMFRAALDKEFPGRIFLAEANQWPEDAKDYFGHGDECHMAFHFPLMPRMYMAIAREDRFPITDIMRQTPDIPESCQWAIFLRNHDELTLEMVTDTERDYLWQTYAADRRARLNLGIRRRLAPLLERDRRRIELMTSLLLSMPGAPIIYYGDEIGMGDNIYLGDRNGVRTPMHWSPDRNGGFSRADPSALVLPAIMDPLYGYEAVNVESQQRDPHSLLNWTRRMLAVRRQHAVFGRGSLRFLYPKNRKVLAYLRENEGERILCVANMARSAQAVELELSDLAGLTPIEMNGGSIFPPIGQLTYLLTLPPHGFYWFLLAQEADWPSWHTPAPEPMPEYITVVLRQSLAAALSSSARPVLERESLPAYLGKRRWFAAKDQSLREVRLSRLAPVPDSSREMLLAEVETTTDRGVSRWLLPLTVSWDEEQGSPLPSQLALARVRWGRKVGFLTDAFAVPEFARFILRGLAERACFASDGGEIRFEPTSRWEGCEAPASAEILWLSAEQSNSSLVVGDVAMVKIFRRLSDGVHPEAEMGRYLTEQGFANVPPLLGEVVRVSAEGQRVSLAVAQGFVRNQGDGWTWTLDHLRRALDDLGTPGKDTASETDHLQAYEAFAATVGNRLGEMHAVLARPTDDAAFAPVKASEEDVAAWTDRCGRMLGDALAAIAERKGWANPADEDAAKALLSRRKRLSAALASMARVAPSAAMARIHGDFHLGQLIVSSGDAFIIDFEGEPGRPIAERRAKTSPLRDVAGFLRSLDYAAAVVKRKDPASHAALPEEKREELIASFMSRAAAAFLAAYKQAFGAFEASDVRLLNLFLLEKAAYEVLYEAANRPNWIDVPLAGLARHAAVILERSRG
jgi:maltose alpha-D-glucosyltransferase / alpha-amylase